MFLGTPWRHGDIIVDVAFEKIVENAPKNVTCQPQSFILSGGK
jgi:hypothetical protein